MLWESVLNQLPFRSVYFYYHRVHFRGKWTNHCVEDVNELSTQGPQCAPSNSILASNSSGNLGFALSGRSNGSSGHSMSSSSSSLSSNADLGMSLDPSVSGWSANALTWVVYVVLSGHEGDQSSALTKSIGCRRSLVPQMGRMCYKTACHHVDSVVPGNNGWPW